MTRPDPTAEAPISTERLELVLLTGAWLRAYVGGDPLPDLGFIAPDAFLAGTEHVVRLRAEQLAHDPAQEPWLLRAMVVRDSSTAVGYVNFHAPPDDRGMVEIGYQVLPVHRRRGYATEAAQGMWDWAVRHGARVLRAAIAPANVSSLAMVHRAGFIEVGQQMDDVDGLELIFEKQVQASPVQSPQIAGGDAGRGGGEAHEEAERDVWRRTRRAYDPVVLDELRRRS